MSTWRRLLAATCMAAVGCGGSNAPLHGYVFDPPRDAPALQILDADGTLYDLASERGKRTVVLFFGYTHCPDVCPTTLAAWASARRELGGAEKGVRWLFVSVDPERDTPQVAQGYARQFDPTFVGLSPTVEQLEALQKTWGFRVMREDDPKGAGSYTVMHPARTYVIDRAGRIRELLSQNTAASDIAMDVRQIR
ncbi:MAG: SCO family protein [Gemmatimonadaceae bacterium]|nr:SCO family protein [Gemmatimonadaceae bacterium]